jgi:hypothetical protein
MLHFLKELQAKQAFLGEKALVMHSKWPKCAQNVQFFELFEALP